jgi:hypothetical protein
VVEKSGGLHVVHKGVEGFNKRVKNLARGLLEVTPGRDVPAGEVPELLSGRSFTERSTRSTRLSSIYTPSPKLQGLVRALSIGAVCAIILAIQVQCFTAGPTYCVVVLPCKHDYAREDCLSRAYQEDHGGNELLMDEALQDLDTDPSDARVRIRDVQSELWGGPSCCPEKKSRYGPFGVLRHLFTPWIALVLVVSIFGSKNETRNTFRLRMYTKLYCGIFWTYPILLYARVYLISECNVLHIIEIYPVLLYFQRSFFMLTYACLMMTMYEKLRLLNQDTHRIRMECYVCAYFASIVIQYIKYKGKRAPEETFIAGVIDTFLFSRCTYFAVDGMRAAAATAKDEADQMKRVLDDHVEPATREYRRAMRSIQRAYAAGSYTEMTARVTGYSAITTLIFFFCKTLNNFSNYSYQEAASLSLMLDIVFNAASTILMSGRVSTKYCSPARWMSSGGNRESHCAS